MDLYGNCRGNQLPVESRSESVPSRCDGFAVPLSVVTRGTRWFTKAKPKPASSNSALYAKNAASTVQCEEMPITQLGNSGLSRCKQQCRPRGQPSSTSRSPALRKTSKRSNNSMKNERIVLITNFKLI